MLILLSHTQLSRNKPQNSQTYHAIYQGIYIFRWFCKHFDCMCVRVSWAWVDFAQYLQPKTIHTRLWFNSGSTWGCWSGSDMIYMRNQRVGQQDWVWRQQYFDHNREGRADTDTCTTHFHTGPSEFNIALHKPSWQNTSYRFPTSAVGVDGDIYTRIAGSQSDDIFFAIDLGSYIAIESVKMVILQQGILGFARFILEFIKMYIYIFIYHTNFFSYGIYVYIYIYIFDLNWYWYQYSKSNLHTLCRSKVRKYFWSRLLLNVPVNIYRSMNALS